MRKPKKFGIYSTGLLSAVLVLSACGGGSTPSDGDGNNNSSSSEAGGSFSVYVCEPESLIPQNTNETCGAEVLNALFTPLVNFNPENSDPEFGEGVGNAHAVSIESEDQKNWTVKIKDGWTFHNGEPVDAAAYARGWNAGALSTNAYGNSYFFENIVGYADLQAPTDADGNPTGEPKATEMSGLKVVDDTTFTVELTAPFSQFPLTLGYTAFYPLPKAY